MKCETCGAALHPRCHDDPVLYCPETKLCYFCGHEYHYGDESAPDTSCKGCGRLVCDECMTPHYKACHEQNPDAWTLEPITAKVRALKPLEPWDKEVRS